MALQDLGALLQKLLLYVLRHGGAAWAALRRRLRALLLAAAARLAAAAAALPVTSAEEAADSRRTLTEARESLATAEVQLTASQLHTLPPVPRGPSSQLRGKIFIDGVFDLMHFGHMNAFRQARALGSCLVVGVNSDESVAIAKGLLPVLRDEERQAAVAACRFVDEIVPASPYVMTAEYIQELVDTRGIDCFVHGDDPCFVDGVDVYEAAKKAGRFCTIPRTEGISTTDIVGRLLLLSRDHHAAILPGGEEGGSSSSSSPATGVFASEQSNFLVTSGLLRLFSGALPPHRGKGAKVVYVDGAWDMFHAGHVALLRRAHELGDYLVAGVHSDAVVNKHRGSNFPIMNMQERVLSILGCRYVDDVLLDAPWAITREMVATLGISVVVRGTVRDCAACVSEPHDPHTVPKALGIHVELPSEVDLTIEHIAARLQSRHREMRARHEEKQRKEEEWYRTKHGLDQPK